MCCNDIVGGLEVLEKSYQCQINRLGVCAGILDGDEDEREEYSQKATFLPVHIGRKACYLLGQRREPSIFVDLLA